MTAARTGSAAVVRLLLARGADVNAAEGARGQTALMWAASQQHEPIVRALIAAGADVHARARSRTVLVNRGDFNTSRINQIEEVERGGFTALLFAARQGDLATARALLEAGADADDTAPDGTSALVLAAHSGHGRLAAFFLEHGADPNADGAGYTALHAAVLRGDVGLVNALLARGADPDAVITKGNPLRRFGFQEFVLPGFLVGSTAYLLAARYAEVDIMRVLAQRSAHPGLAMPDGTTALMLAAGVGWADVGVGGISDRRGRYLPAGFTSPGSLPDWSRTLAAVTVALDLGADPAAVNKAGDTAAHGAAAKGFDGVLELLAARGARLDVKNRRAQTPVSLAAARPELGRTVELLRRLGATE
jgi:ankyrin repeat protein